MTIYAILTSIPHNHHYVKRYVSFIEGCQKVNEDYTGYTEKHHICPKSLFPEYKSFSKHPWNKAVLTPRQHFIAHHLLWKAYREMKSMMYAFFLMCHKNNNKLDSRTYSRLSEEHNKTHHLLGGEIQRETNRKRIEDGTHHWLGDGEYQRSVQEKRIEDGTHHWLGNGEYQRSVQEKRIEDGTHNFLGGEIQRETNRKRIENGTHHWLGDGEYQRNTQRKRVEDGTHHCLGVVNSYDKQGTFIRVPKEIYHSQTGPIEDREYVHFRTKEAKRRKALRLPV